MARQDSQAKEGRWKHEGRVATNDLKNMVRNDLTEYGVQTTLRELLQNADDAGAKRVAIHLFGPNPELPEEILVCPPQEKRVISLVLRSVERNTR